MAHRASRIAHRASRIAHRASRIAHRASRIAHRASRIAHRASAHPAAGSARRVGAQCADARSPLARRAIDTRAAAGRRGVHDTVQRHVATHAAMRRHDQRQSTRAAPPSARTAAVARAGEARACRRPSANTHAASTRAP
ncbi:hypothetical protein GSF21_05300 [Burkholderia pseudomallei]|nr:hypothetical protein [Burkholderia pseudomallei]MXQ32651.1 hypothetical protein [Burkholderia pseudomallei]